jgi:hypothetical protein
MAEPTQLSGVDGVYKNNNLLFFIFSTGTERKNFLCKFFLCSFCLDKEIGTKTIGIRIYLRKKIADKL